MKESINKIESIIQFASLNISTELKRGKHADLSQEAMQIIKKHFRWAASEFIDVQSEMMQNLFSKWEEHKFQKIANKS